MAVRAVVARLSLRISNQRRCKSETGPGDLRGRGANQRRRLGIPCTRWTSAALEWSELKNALQLHENVLYSLDREAEAADVARKYNEIFGSSDDEGEDQSEEEEGETGAKGEEDGVV